MANNAAKSAKSIKPVRKVRKKNYVKYIESIKSDKNNNSSNYLKNKRKLQTAGSRFKSFLFILIMLITVLTVFFFLTNKYFFKVQKVIINDIYGNEKYSYEDVLNASGIAMGSELYGIDLKQAKYDIKKQLTYVDNINIIRIPPSTVSIEIKTDKEMFGIKLGGDYYIISENFMVAEKIDIVGQGESGAEDFTPPEGIMTLAADSVKKCCVGEKIEFFDTDISDFIQEIVALFKEYDLPATMKSMNIEIKSINMKDKFNIVMNYGDRFLVKFGIFENISSKVLNSLDIIKRIPDNFKGIIDMTNEKVGSFEYDENILKNKLYYNVQIH